MPCVHNHGNAGENTRDDTVMMDQVIMCVKNIRPVAPQLPYHLPHGAEVWPSGLLKRSNAYTCRGRFSCNSTGMGEAIEYRHMAFGKLTICKVDCQPFKSTHIEIVDKLYDSHRALKAPFFHSGLLDSCH